MRRSHSLLLLAGAALAPGCAAPSGGEAGTAPPWIAANLDTLEVIERKTFNRHRFLENLRLAFTFPGQVLPEAR